MAVIFIMQYSWNATCQKQEISSKQGNIRNENFHFSRDFQSDFSIKGTIWKMYFFLELRGIAFFIHYFKRLNMETKEQSKRSDF